MCINESRAHKLPVCKPAYYERRSSDPTVMKKDIVQFALIRVVHNEGDSPIRFDPQDGAGNVLDLRRSQGVNQGPNENLPACLWHGHVGEFESGFGASQGKGEESKLEMQYIDVLCWRRAHMAFEMRNERQRSSQA